MFLLYRKSNTDIFHKLITGFDESLSSSSEYFQNSSSDQFRNYTDTFIAEKLSQSSLNVYEYDNILIVKRRIIQLE